jgi:hypothetical protein
MRQLGYLLHYLAEQALVATPTPRHQYAWDTELLQEPHVVVV